MNLAKQPASTVQILGAEKALFRALKTKHDTPKYGLIYHASLIGQAAPKNKGKISRVLAAKASLAIRVDALTDDTDEQMDTTIGFEGRAKVEARLRQLEGGVAPSLGSGGMTAKKTARYDPVAAKTGASAQAYNDASDMVLDAKKKDSDDDDDSSSADGSAEKKKKKKKDKKEKKEKKSKKRKADDDVEETNGNGEDDAAAKKSAKKSAKKAKKEKRKSKD
jgi:nucleolar protein 58